MADKTVDVLSRLHKLGLPAVATMSGAQSAEYAKVCADFTELVEAARNASATLGHIYHTTPLPAELERHAHDGYQRLDAAIAAVSPPKAPGHCDHSWATKSVTGGLVKVCERCGLVPPDGAIRAVGGAE